MKEAVLGIIDAQRGFMPTPEGEKLDRAGFGELPVADGQRIIPVVKRLLWAAGQQNTFTTQDWHPEHTAHFSENPDFATNWPVHCVGDTKGAELHPELESALGPSVTRFYKGQECLEDGKDDLSYSGYYGTTDEGMSLPEWLLERKAQHVVLGGLALDYCVGKTALDIRSMMGLEVTIAIDATRAIHTDDLAIEETIAEFTDAGISIRYADDLIREMEAK